MNKLITIPKSVDIKMGDFHIVIKDHEITTSKPFDFGGILLSMARAIEQGMWPYFLKKATFQGFKYEGFAEYYSAKLKNDWKTIRGIIWVQGDNISKYIDWAGSARFAQSSAGNVLIKQCVEMLMHCKSWEEFGKNMSEDGDFFKNLEKNITREARAWSKV